MSEPHWVESLYETSILRDLLGYGLPGMLLLVGALTELGHGDVVNFIATNTSAFIAFIASSYGVAVLLRVTGTAIPVLVFHRSWGLLGQTESTLSSHPSIVLQRLLWQPNKDRLNVAYAALDQSKISAMVEREGMFMHLCGLMAMSLFVLSCVVLALPHDGLSNWLRVPEYQVVLSMLATGFLFLLGHYRHAFQYRFLALIGAG